MPMISRFEISSLSDEALDQLIGMVEDRLQFLKEVKQSRGGHVALKWKFVKGSKIRISKVTCSCGHVTEYRVPLTHISEFECPKEKKGAHGKILSVSQSTDEIHRRT